MKKLTLKEEFRYAILSAIHDEGLEISDAIDTAFEAVIRPALDSYPDEKTDAQSVNVLPVPGGPKCRLGYF